jgi:hypothetical protein
MRANFSRDTRGARAAREPRAGRVRAARGERVPWLRPPLPPASRTVSRRQARRRDLPVPVVTAARH